MARGGPGVKRDVAPSTIMSQEDLDSTLTPGMPVREKRARRQRLRLKRLSMAVAIYVIYGLLQVIMGWFGLGMTMLLAMVLRVPSSASA